MLDHIHPLTRFLFTEMERKRMGYKTVAAETGISKNTIKSWRTQRSPRVADLEACLNVVGYTLRPVPRSLNDLR